MPSDTDTDKDKDTKRDKESAYMDKKFNSAYIYYGQMPLLNLSKK
jgi:hypothetical protein